MYAVKVHSINQLFFCFYNFCCRCVYLVYLFVIVSFSIYYDELLLLLLLLFYLSIYLISVNQIKICSYHIEK